MLKLGRYFCLQEAITSSSQSIPSVSAFPTWVFLSSWNWVSDFFQIHALKIIRGVLLWKPQKKCLCNSRITVVQLVVLDFWGPCFSNKSSCLSFSFYAENMHRNCMIQGVHLMQDLIFFSCIEGGQKTHTFVSSDMGGFGKYSSHSQKQPISFKCRVLVTWWRWKIQYINFPFSSQCKPNLMSRVLETRRHELCSTQCPGSGISWTSWQTAILPCLGARNCCRNEHLNCRNGSFHPPVVVVKTA